MWYVTSRFCQHLLSTDFVTQATYIRLLYSTKITGPNPAPASCFRTVVGTAEYQVFGWTAHAKTAAYLIPVTLVNLSSLILLGIGMSIRDRGEGRLPRFDPTDPESLVYSSDQRGELLRDIMADKRARGPGKKKALFGRGDDRTVRLWVGDVVSLFSLDFTIYHRPLFCDTVESQTNPRGSGKRSRRSRGFGETAVRKCRHKGTSALKFDKRS